MITKLELRKIASALDKSGTILIPLEVYISKRGLIKLTIGIGKLMRKVEKKQILKEKDIKRMEKLRDSLIDGLLKIPNCSLNGPTKSKV